ncbi:hypothetical protein ACFQ15_06765 [Sphingomonas hankookensis]|uniref:hypothetical protein n=1 Tax=Sphingomonas hankookensis TaxID=563996 RepID=UPI001F5791AE|nr:hypothetical protein [Sphingomonas hankookensis]
MATYSYICASDLNRDGLGLELWRGGEMIGEVFRWDNSFDKVEHPIGKLTISLWGKDVPLPVVDDWIEHAKRRLTDYPLE